MYKINRSQNLYINNIAMDLKLFSHKNRIKILLLGHEEEGGISVSDIKSRLKIGDATYKFHIAALRRAKMINSKRTQNSNVFFTPTTKAIKILKMLEIIK